MVENMFILLISSLTLGTYYLSASTLTFRSNESPIMCNINCRASLVESIPQNLTFSSLSVRYMSTYDAIMSLITSAKHKVEISSVYWTLQRADVTPNDDSANEGQKIFDALLSAGRDRHINISIVKEKTWRGSSSDDTDILANIAGAKVHELNITKYLGSGITHSKMWLIDRKSFYVGSANLDWRSYTQVKELGILVTNCSCLAEDMGSIFDIYVYLSQKDAKIPKKWPSKYDAIANVTHPLSVDFNNVSTTSFLSSSPPQFCSTGRTSDIDAILHSINSAKKFIYISVMTYYASTQFQKHNVYWPVIDDALRHASFDRGVKVYLLGSLWNHTSPKMYKFLHSLSDVSKTGRGEIQVKMFVVPSYTKMQASIPYSRVNHDKYMVTETTAYIGTSNWSGDYFISTGGIGFIANDVQITDSSLRSQLEEIFLRDWNSKYARPVPQAAYQPYSVVNSEFFASSCAELLLTTHGLAVFVIYVSMVNAINL